MFKLNSHDLEVLVNVKSHSFKNAYKNIYKNDDDTVEQELKINGVITLNCEVTSVNNSELAYKLNKLESILNDGILEIDTKAYNVALISKLEQGMDFSDFNIVFSWDGTYTEDGTVYDITQ